MDNIYFLDTAFLIAINAKDDQYHSEAVTCWNSIRAQKPRIVITSAIFEEVVTLLNGRRSHALAVQVGTYLLMSPVVEMVHVDPDLLIKGWSYFVRHQDKRYSLTDCISFVVMKRPGSASSAHL